MGLEIIIIIIIIILYLTTCHLGAESLFQRECEIASQHTQDFKALHFMMMKNK